jgi:hypothetical protein
MLVKSRLHWSAPRSFSGWVLVLPLSRTLDPRARSHRSAPQPPAATTGAPPHQVEGRPLDGVVEEILRRVSCSPESSMRVRRGSFLRP